EPVEDPVDAVAGEEADQVILGGEEEPRLPRVALTAGAAAKLVVDPARLVALGAEDEQAAELLDPLVVRLRVLLDLRDDLVVGALVLLVVELESPLAKLGASEVVGVPPEHDVDAAAGHVGRDRDRARAPRLGDRLALALG